MQTWTFIIQDDAYNENDYEVKERQSEQIGIANDDTDELEWLDQVTLMKSHTVTFVLL